jgi:general secretion pathway protein E
MGIEDYLLTSTINGVLAQRLVRVLCPVCCERYAVAPEVIEELHLRRYADSDSLAFYRATGCLQCNGTGYNGRTTILEFLTVSDPVRRLVIRGADATEIQTAAIEAGMRTMYDDGIRKALSGITSIEEVVRVTRES